MKSFERIYRPTSTTDQKRHDMIEKEIMKEFPPKKSNDDGDKWIDFEIRVNRLIDLLYHGSDEFLIPALVAETGLTTKEVHATIHNIELAKCDMSIELTNLVWEKKNEI